jgi:hypothetical protein
MTTPTTPKISNLKRMIKKIGWLLAIVVVLFIGTLIYWNYFFTYSEGYRAGLLQKFSKKGAMFKTYEGEMILSSITSNQNVALASEKFLFSVTDEKLASQLDTIQGQFVILHYTQKNSKLPWRGESLYLVDAVKIKKE